MISLDAPDELAAMLEDTNQFGGVFAASSYWKQYQEPSLRHIIKNGISLFRNGSFPQWSSFSAVINPYAQNGKDVVAKH